MRDQYWLDLFDKHAISKPPRSSLGWDTPVAIEKTVAYMGRLLHYIGGTWYAHEEDGFIKVRKKHQAILTDWYIKNHD